jgi:CPA2 family monovalent cation:H+ antiporter-2
MHAPSWLADLALVTVAGVVVAAALARARLPVVAGLLASGALVGPAGLGWVSNTEHIAGLAETGVVLLLFTIGLEFSLQRLRRIARLVMVGGTLQVGITIAAVTGAGLAWGLDVSFAVFLGFVFALSSTAIVLRALDERTEVDAPHGRFIVGVLIFQDLCVIPLMLIVPALGSGDDPSQVASQIGLALGKAGLVVVGALVIARVVVPRLLDVVAASRSREVFLLAVVTVCMGTAWLSSLAGLSLALGAFVAGVVLADSDYAHRALSDVLPLRDLFASLFFISLGMLFDVGVLVERPFLVLALLLAFVLGKGFIVTLAALAMRFPARVAWLAGVALAQFGEFGFVLATEGLRAGVTTQEQLAPVLAAGLISMFLTRIVIGLAPHVKGGEAVLRPLERLIGVRGSDEVSNIDAGLQDHVIVAGFGTAGRQLVEALQATGTPHVVLELNVDSVREAQARGIPAYYGDVTSAEVRHHARLPSARAVVLLINDRQAVQRAAEGIRRNREDVFLMVRTRYLADRPNLFRLGVNEVVCEEVVAGHVVMGRLLAELGIDTEQANHLVSDAREALGPARTALP